MSPGFAGDTPPLRFIVRLIGANCTLNHIVRDVDDAQ